MTRDRRLLFIVAGIAALTLVAAPALAAKPEGPELTKTLSGTVSSVEDGKGRPGFQMTVGGVTWELSAGPKWFWGASNPLAAFVGKAVEVTGTYRAGETDLDVDTVDGAAIRPPGRPAWAGGPKVVGKSHPGWKDGKPGKGQGRARGHGRANAPGQLKDRTEESSTD
jgi:hypothetical protein